MFINIIVHNIVGAKLSRHFYLYNDDKIFQFQDIYAWKNEKEENEKNRSRSYSSLQFLPDSKLYVSSTQILHLMQTRVSDT